MPFGNIVVFIALIFKNKTAAALAFCLNMPFAYASLVEASALEGYDTIIYIRAQAYIWGHLLIVVGSAYAILISKIRFGLKHLLNAFIVALILFIIGNVFNILFQGLGYSTNYFYSFSSSGVPFGMFENLAPKIDILYRNSTNVFAVWDYFYSLMVVLIGIFAMLLMYGLSKVLYNLDDDANEKKQANEFIGEVRTITE